MLGEHPTIDIPQSTEYAKEMRKWESHHTRYGAPGRPYTFQDYPRMMYRFAYVDGKGIVKAEERQAADEQEERNLQSRGFHFGPQAAHDAIRAEQTEHGRLAAERNWEAAHGRLSERAVAEMRAHEAEHGAQHLPMVPETPIKKRGRPKKVVAPA